MNDSMNRLAFLYVARACSELPDKMYFCISRDVSGKVNVGIQAETLRLVEAVKAEFLECLWSNLELWTSPNGHTWWECRGKCDAFSVHVYNCQEAPAEAAQDNGAWCLGDPNEVP